MPACGPRHGSIDGPVRPNFSNNNTRPSRGAKPREADDAKTSLGAASLGWLPRSGDIYARGTSRGSHDVSHDDQGQAGASKRRGGSFLFDAKEASAGEEYRGIGQRLPYQCNETKTRRRQDGGHRRAHRSVTTRSFSQAKITFLRIRCTTCPLSNWPLWHPFPLNIWEEDQGLYK